MALLNSLKSLVVALLFMPALVLAQSYPAKPVRLVVPFPAGGTTDLVARMVQAKFQEFLGAQVLIDNRGGAGGSIGANEVARAAPDGYTLLMVFDTHATNHHVYKDALDPFKHLEHLMLMVSSPSSLVFTTSFAPSSLKELVTAAKSSPGTVTYATTGTASSNHLGALLLEQAAGIRMLHIPYKGGGPMVQALLGQQVNIAFISTPLILPHIRAGKVKAIATGGAKRMAALPDLPTVAEGYPGFLQMSWFGLLVPAGVPKDISARIHRDMERTLQAPEVRQKLMDAGFEVVGGSPAEFLKFAREESDKLGKLIRDSGIKVE